MEQRVKSVAEFLDSQHQINVKSDADAYIARLHGVAKQIDAETDRVRRDGAFADAYAQLAPRIAVGASQTFTITFDPETDVVFSDAISPDGSEPFHVNNVRFVARDGDGAELAARSYYSVGGGFVVGEAFAATA